MYWFMYQALENGRRPAKVVYRQQINTENRIIFLQFKIKLNRVARSSHSIAVHLNSLLRCPNCVCEKKVFVAVRSISHEMWTTRPLQRSAFNIALVELPEESRHQVPQILVDHVQLTTGQQLYALGFGSYEGPRLGETTFGALKSEAQEFIDGVRCNGSTLWNGTLPMDMICGLNEIRRSSCTGESMYRVITSVSPCQQIRRENAESFWMSHKVASNKIGKGNSRISR